MKLLKSQLSLNREEKYESTFALLKEKLCSTPILTLPEFTKAFEIRCDASRIRIGGVLMQD